MFIGAISNRNNGAESAAMKSLMEECSLLRQRVKELSDNNRDSNGSTRTVNTEADAADQAEVAALRKELAKVENEKASMELDFMNQLSQIAIAQDRSTRDVGVVQHEPERSKNVLNSKVPSSQHQSSSDEIQQLKLDLKAADKELQVNRKDVEEMFKKVKKLEDQKLGLLDQLAEMRLEVDNGTKVIFSLNDAMEESEKHFRHTIEKLETELTSKNNLLTKQAEDLKMKNDEIERVGGQKSMLLEEITDLRMQLDRNDDATKVMKKKIEELTNAQNGLEESSRIGFLKQAAMDAEEKSGDIQAKMESLENEMRSNAKSYKEDICRLEEGLAIKGNEYDKVYNDLCQKDAEIMTLRNQKMESENTLKEIHITLEEKQRIIVDLERQILSESEKHAAETKKKILSHTTEDDNMVDRLAELERVTKTLTKKLAFEMDMNGTLKTQLLEAKKQRSSPVSTSCKRDPAPPRISPLSASSKRDPPPPRISPLSTSNKRDTAPPRISPLSTSSKRDPALPSVLHKYAFSQKPSIVTNRSESPSSRSSYLPSPTFSASSDPPSNRSVKALAARFESNKRVTESTSPPVIETRVFVFPEAEPEMRAPEAEPETETPDAEDFRRQINDLESQLDEARSHNKFLQGKVQKQCEQIAELQAEAASLNAARVSIKQASRKELEQAKLESLGKIERLESELSAAKKQAEIESKMVETLQKEVNEMTSERLAYEACTVDAFEKQKVKGQKSHQSELNSLQNDLTRAQMKLASIEKEHDKQVKELEETIEELNVDCDKEVEEMRGEVDMYKHMYEQQLDLVATLEKERSQICSQMKNISNGRREELEELQSALMDKSAAVTSLTRELETVQMQVEHQTDNTNELEYLRERVRELENQREPKGTAKHMQGFELEKFEEENRKLREQVRNITVERRGLQERLKAVVEERNAVRSQPQVLRDRNEKLKREVARLYKKLELIEGGASRIAI